MSAFRISLAVTLAACMGWAGSARAEEPKAPEKTELPQGIEKLEPEMQAKLEKLMEGAVKFRGLKAKSGVPMGQLDKDGLKVKVVDMYAKEMPADVLKPMERSLKVFKLIPKNMDLATYLPELMTSQIGGFYDPKQKYLVMVKQGKKDEVSAVEKKYGKTLAGKMDEIVMVHEMTHSLQDQYFDLNKFHNDKVIADSAAARLALIEGDATHVMYSYFYDKPLEELPGLAEVMESMTSNPEALMGAMPDMPGAKEMLAAPAYFRDTLLFSYMQGMVFTIQVRKAGGQALLDYAFTKDPPRSTEQILHPSKWFGDRDEAAVLPINLKPGVKIVSGGSWGEFSTRIVLEEWLKPLTGEREKCLKAAAGWGGDAFVLIDIDNKDVGLWTTAWDTTKDAREFYEVVKEGLKDESRLLMEAGDSPRRVFIVMGDCSAEQRAELLKQMSDSPITWPESKKLDLAAFKAKSAELAGRKPAVPPDDQIKKALGDADDDGLALLKNKDLKAVLDDPEFQKQLEKMLGGTGDGKMDVGEMLKNPAVQKMIEQMMAGGKQPEGGMKDGVYTNPELGFAITMPKGDTWKNMKPEAVMGQKPLVQFIEAGPDGRATVAVLMQNLPMQLTIEAMGPMMEMGPKMMMKNFNKIAGDFVQSGAQKGFSLEYTAEANGASMHLIQRVYILGGKMLIVQGGTSTDNWAAQEKAIRASIESTTFTEKKGEAKPVQKALELDIPTPPPAPEREKLKE